MKQIKTGIAGIDWFLQGGLPPKIILFSGIPGSGNDILARQIAYLKAKQDPISYFIVHTPSDGVKEDMATYGWDITQLIEDGNWKFHKLTRQKSLIDKVLSEMEQRKTIVIDSLSELLFNHKIEEVIDLVTAMSRKNKDGENFHMLILTKGMQSQLAETTLEHFAEGVILFNTSWSTDSTTRDILVKKMRGITVPTRKLQYSLGKKGFVIETAKRLPRE